MSWVTLTPSKDDMERATKSNVRNPSFTEMPQYWARPQRFRLASIFNYSYDPGQHQTLLTVAGALHSVIGDHTATLDELLGGG